MWLTASNWNIAAASTAFQANVADAEGRSSGDDDDSSMDQSLDPAHTSSGGLSSSQPKRAGQGKKFATLGDLGASQAPAEDHDDDDEDQDFFAGGEKSGLAVQNPDDLKRKILEKARR